MAFWNRKREENIIEYSNQPSAKDMLTELKETIRLSNESHVKMTDALLRSNHELVKALNSATREFKKSK